MVIHRSTPGTNEGGLPLTSSASSASSAAAAAARRNQQNGGVSDYGSSAQPARNIPVPPSANSPNANGGSNGGVSTVTSVTPTASEHYFPQLVDAVLHSITPATDRALQIVADEAAKEKQMSRLRQAGSGGGNSPTNAADDTTAAVAATPSKGLGGQRGSTVGLLTASAENNADCGADGAATPAAAADGTTNNLSSQQLSATPRGDATKGLSPALALALKAAASRGEAPSAPNSARSHYRGSYSNTTNNTTFNSTAADGRPATAGAASSSHHVSTFGSSTGLLPASPRFTIYSANANYALPVHEHGRTLEVEGLPPSRFSHHNQKRRKSGFAPRVGFDGHDESDDDDDDDEEKAKKKGLKRTASLRRKSSMRALAEFEAKRPTKDGGSGADNRSGGGDSSSPAPLAANGWSSEMNIFEFDGLRSYLQLPTVPDLDNLIKSFAVDFWFLTDCRMADGRRTLLQIGDQNNSGRHEVGMQLHIGLNWYPDMDEGIRLYIRDASNRVCEVHIPFSTVSTGPSILEGNEPHHVRIHVINLEESYIHAFIDGEAVENLKFLQTERAATFSTWTGQLFIGGVPSGEGGIQIQQQEVLNPLRGSLFELRFWRGEGNFYSANSPFATGAGGVAGTSGGFGFGGNMGASTIANNGNAAMLAGSMMGGGKGFTAAEMKLQEKLQSSEPWVRWPLINPPTAAADAADDNGDGIVSTPRLGSSGGRGGGRAGSAQLLMQEATRRVPADHLEVRNELSVIRRYNPRVSPVFDGASTVINMGTMSCLGDFLNHFEMEFVFRTTETKKCMSLMGFTDSQHKMSEVGVVLNAEPVMGKERYRHHDYTITFYMIDCSGRCLSAFIRGSERNNVMDGRWHTLRIKVVDAEQCAVEARIDGLTRETIKVVRESPRTFLALKDWVCVGGHNDRGNKVTNIFVGQISHVNFLIRGEDFATLDFTEGPGSTISLDQSGRRNHGLFLNPQTNRNKKHSMEWGLIFDPPAASPSSPHGIAGSHNGGAAGGAITSNSTNVFDTILATQQALYGADVVEGFAVMHRNNAVSVAVIQFGAAVDAESGKASEVMFDLIHNSQISDLEQCYGAMSEVDRGFGSWLTIPEENYAEVNNAQRLRETVSYALRHSTVRAATMRHTLVVVRIGDAHISLLDVSGPHYQGSMDGQPVTTTLMAPANAAHNASGRGGANAAAAAAVLTPPTSLLHSHVNTSISFDRQLLKWVPHAVATNGDVNKKMLVVNDQTAGLWRTMRELTAVPNIVLKLGPRNQPHNKVTSAELLHALQDAGTRWRLAMAVQHLLMNAYLRTNVHFVCSVSVNATSSDVESIVAPQRALSDCAMERAAIFIQRIWRRKLAMLLVQRLTERQRIRRLHVEEVINLRKTNPLVLAKKALKALVITLHEFSQNPCFEPLDPTVPDEVIAALGRQGYVIEHLRNPTKAQLAKALGPATMHPDSSHFVYIHGYGGYVRQRAAPPLFIHRLDLSMEEEAGREEVMLQATIALGHITKERYEDLARVKAVLAAMPVKKGKKKVIGGVPLSPRAASPLNATQNTNIPSATASRPTTAAAASGLNTTPRRPASTIVSSPRARAAQSKAQIQAALLAQQNAIKEEFRVIREDLEAAEQHSRVQEVMLYEEHSRVLLLQEFGKVIRQYQDFVRRQEEAEEHQSAVAAATVTMRPREVFTGNDSLFKTTTTTTNALNVTAKSSTSAATATTAFSKHPAASNWYLYPSDARRVEALPADLVSVDDIIARALQQPTPPLGYQCVVAVDLVAPSPACHGGAMLYSTTGHHFTYAYDGTGCLAEYGGKAKKAAATAAGGFSAAPPAGGRSGNRGAAGRKSFTSMGITGGAAVAAGPSSAANHAAAAAGLSNNATAAAAYGNTSQQQSNVLSWVLAKALNGHVPKLPLKGKEWYLQGACDLPTSSSSTSSNGQRDWKSFATYVATKVDAYVRNDTTARERKEDEAIKKRQAERDQIAANASRNSISTGSAGGGSEQQLLVLQRFASDSNNTANANAAMISSSSNAAPAVATSPSRKRLSVVLANAPSVTPAVKMMLGEDKPYAADLVPLRAMPFGPEEREARRRDRDMRRVTSFVKIGVESSRIVGDMQYEFRPLLKHVNVTDIIMCPTVRMLLVDGNKSVEAVDVEWIKAEAMKLFAPLSSDLSVGNITVYGSGIYIDVVHAKSDRTKTLQATQILASKSSQWSAVPLANFAAMTKEAAVDYSQVLFLVKCSSPMRKMRQTMKDLLLAAPMNVPRYLTVLKYGLNVE